MNFNISIRDLVLLSITLSTLVASFVTLQNQFSTLEAKTNGRFAVVEERMRGFGTQFERIESLLRRIESKLDDKADKAQILQ